MNWKDYLDSNPSILFGKMVVKDTRIPVDLILEKLGNGLSIETILNAYPRLSSDSILACLLYASESIKHEKTLAIA
jgi:uncharacterized protein (DUF433 family)